MTFEEIVAKIEALAGIAKAVAPEAAAQIEAATADAHAAVTATQTAVVDATAVAAATAKAAAGATPAGELLQGVESLAEPTLEAAATKLLTPVFKTQAAAVAAKFVAGGEAAIAALLVA